ncbi:hypothetical protein SELMODRAFT_97494 [Selaginella moellendorffii]|uniref:Uncharacterized protein AO2-2 n=1 Tax=Selaginella moellendorffii TaxID=88036 RepID=D8RMY1_SELML|nr:probable aldehyde oxidase 3 isoform X1 [Selaginella moellendorffii]EFJ26415.1 hypothetical protein SELMODRAFT_97494 [Selaginella moellendorffii]|eukprot:XP_002972329.1 probable aldehyde oxidase 3 isoform X1 [Selaginella moellendorffii]
MALLFALNGRKIELSDVDPSMTLLEFLRCHTDLKGTKLGCGEGGCGACVVVASRYDASTDSVEEVSINSCLALLGSLHLRAVTTIEGLGSSKTRLHAVQRRFLGFHASQCGFCTPGMCMSLYGGLKNQQRRVSVDGGKYESGALEQSIQGSLCRCTGYRPIVDVCKSFGSSVDVEDLGLNIFWKDRKDGRMELLPCYDPGDDPKFPEFLKQEIIQRQSANVVQDSNGTSAMIEHEKWICATSFGHAFGLLKHFQTRSKTSKEVKIVVGNTSAGVYRDWDHSVFIDISRIPELHVVEARSDGIEFGAAVSIAKLIDFLDENFKKAGSAIAKHLRKVASPHVRNAGSVGGNLIMAQKFGFDSDIATVFLGFGATLKLLVSPDKQVIQSMEEFLEGGGGVDDYPSSLLTMIFLPLRSHEAAEFKTYRASPRPLGNAVAYANAAFVVRFSKLSSGSSVYKVESSRLAFGAIGDKHAIRAIQVEEFLKGKIITAEVLLEAIQMLKSLLTLETNSRRKSAYRAALAVSFFFKFFKRKLGQGGHHKQSIARDGSVCQQSLIRGCQELHQRDKRRALGQPSEKTMGNLQVSGEAVYIDDIASPSNTLHAAFVCSQKAYAKIKDISVAAAMASPGAVSFMSVKDIPSGGENVGIKSDLANEILFAEEIVECVGQAIGIMIADTPANARRAAKRVQVTYDTESVGEPPILTIEDAVARGSFFQIPAWFESTLQKQHGDISEGLARADHIIKDAEVRMSSQYYFYMETNTALVVPEEDNCLTVFSACQAPEHVQASVAACVGIPMHNVRVITKRVGGAFGGKASKACLVAAACALAAFNLQRPVRLCLDRRTDMVMMGGREPCKAVYTAGFTSDGSVTALQAKLFIQAGWSMDMSWLFTGNMLHALKKFNWGVLDAEFVICKTNIPSRSAMRAPGDGQGSFVADTIIQHVATELGLDFHIVMERNLHSLHTAEAFYGRDFIGGGEGFTLPTVLRRLKDRASFESRLELTKGFNSANLWKKRGLDLVQGTYLVFLVPKPARASVFLDGSVVVEVGGVELGQGLWTKVQQAAAFALSELFGDKEQGVPVSKIRVVQTDSISMPNGSWTAGSTASESSCEAARMCCEALVERLKPVKASLQGSEGVSWESIVAAAKMANVDLSAQELYVAAPEAAAYVTFGAAASEVEVDVLTGEVEILRTDMVYDCGKSMNPAVDIGQIEGAFAQGLGYFVSEECVMDEQGRLLTDGTWTYKPPTADNLPKILNIELLNSPVHEKRILSSKTAGEPPFLLAGSVHAAIRHAVMSARMDAGKKEFFQMDAPASIDRVRAWCGLVNVEDYLVARPSTAQ